MSLDKYTIQDYASDELNFWCPGCGNFGILQAVKMAFTELQLEPTQTVVVSGIGCSSQMPHWLHVNGFHGIHGRALPVATGVHLANPDLHVVVHGGDGDAYGIGMGHFIHTCRRNLDMTYIVHDNQIYALTKGQASPTSEHGFVSASTPGGVPETQINPIKLAISAGATFVARGAAYELNHLKRIIVEGIKHKGFSLIDVMQPCVSMNKINTYQWMKERTYVMDETEYDRTDYVKALEKSLEWDAGIPLGIFYQAVHPTHIEEMGLSKRKSVIYNASPNDITPLLKHYY